MTTQIRRVVDDPSFTGLLYMGVTMMEASTDKVHIDLMMTTIRDILRESNVSDSKAERNAFLSGVILGLTLGDGDYPLDQSVFLIGALIWYARQDLVQDEDLPDINAELGPER